MGYLARILVAAAFAVLGIGAMMLVSATPPLAPAIPAETDSGAPGAGPGTRDRAPGFIGVLVAGEVVDVAARADGLVTEVRVRLGDEVSEGGVIATLDDGPLRDELAMAQAGLKAAQSESEQAGVELAEARERLQRWQGLAAADAGLAVVSREELSTLRYKEKYALQKQQAAQARVAGEQARIKSLLRRIDDTVARAPFSGMVAARYVDAGATVSRGTAIVRLTRKGELWVRFAVPEERGAEAQAGAAVEVRVDSLEPAIAGVIEKVAPEVDPASRMIFVEARLTVLESMAGAPLAGRVSRVHVHAP